VVQTDEQILGVMSDLLLRAGQPTGGGGADAAAIAIARNLTRR
jgi:hypothetical protein